MVLPQALPLLFPVPKESAWLAWTKAPLHAAWSSKGPQVSCLLSLHSPCLQNCAAYTAHTCAGGDAIRVCFAHRICHVSFGLRICAHACGIFMTSVRTSPAQAARHLEKLCLACCLLAPGLWARDTLLHTVAMFLHGSVPQPLRYCLPAHLHQPTHKQQPTAGVGIPLGGLQQQWAPRSAGPCAALQQPALQQSEQCVGAAGQGWRGNPGPDLPGRWDATWASGGSVGGGSPRVEPVLAWGGFGAHGDPLMQAVDGLVGPDWLYIPAGALAPAAPLAASWPAWCAAADQDVFGLVYPANGMLPGLLVVAAAGKHLV